MKPSKQKYKSLIDNDPDINRWLKNMGQGSVVTADVYKRRLGAFCHDLDISPLELRDIGQNDVKRVHDMLIDYVAHMSKETFVAEYGPRKGQIEHYKGSYIFSTTKAVKSWLAFNDIRVGKIKVRGAESRPTLDNEIVPTQEELKRIFLAAPSMRCRVQCVLMAHSGFRPETLGNYEGTDGLRVKDFPEMVIENGKVSFKAQPTRIIVRECLSKANHQYTTFLSDEGCEYLKIYLEHRIAEGEELTPETDIIKPSKKKKGINGEPGKFMRTTKIGSDIKTAIQKAGFDQRPYVLREYFDTQLLMAESKGKITNQYRAFFMGHKGNIEAVYTTNKKRLTHETLEDMREAYRRSQVFFQTSNSGPTEEQSNLNLRKQFLMFVKYSPEEIEKMNWADMSEEEFNALLDKKQVSTALNGTSQKVITEKELEKYLSEGWQYVDKLGSGKVIVKR
jgi:hypothetical protein